MTSPRKKSRKPAGSKKGRTADYEVGYKKPPVESRFKHGQSGNPAGRAKSNAPRTSRKALLQIVHEEAERLIGGTNGEVPAKIALVRSIILHAIKGNVQCQKLASSLIVEADKALPTPEETLDWSKLSDEELEIAMQIFAKLQGIEED